MTQVEKIFTLKTLAPFDGLRDPDLVLIASIAESQHYPAGAAIHGNADPFRCVYVLAGGSWQGPAGELPAILGVGSVLFSQCAPGLVSAGPNGTTCLTISKSHFHTIVNETPELLLGFIALPTGTNGGNFL